MKLCVIYSDLDRAEVLSAGQRQAYQKLVEHMLENISFAFTRQLRGQGNPIGQLWRGCIVAARTFPGLSIRDLAYEREFDRERVLSAPDLIHDCVDGMYGVNNLLANYFHPDGLCYERTPAYHSMTVTLLNRALDALEGYSDPPDYRPADRGWKRFDAFTAPTTGTIGRVQSILGQMVLPNGRRIPIGDSQHGTTSQAPVPTQSTLHPGWGLAALRCGSGPQSTSALLSCGSSMDGHTHLDHLNLVYYSLGQELVTDIGYPVSADPIQNTWWRGSAASHNTVFVDGRNQQRSAEGEVVAFASTPAFQIAQMRDLGPYPDLTDYRRTLVLVGRSDDPDHPRYLIDVFHVAGGTMHDYLLHAQSMQDRPQAAFDVEGLHLEPTDVSASLLDLTPRAEVGEGYEHITELRTGQTDQPWEARWRTHGERDLVLRLIRLTDTAETIFVGRAPGYREGSIRTNTRELTKLICRRTGQEALHSAFASVIEAHPPGEGRIVGARRWDSKGNEEADPVVVEVSTASGRDLAIIAREPGDIAVPGRDVTFDGRVAVMRFDLDGSLLSAAMVEGQCLTVGETRIDAGMATLSGKVVTQPGGLAASVFEEQDAVIEVDVSVPTAAAGRTMTIEHTDGARSVWTIASTEAAGLGRCRITLDRPARLGIGRLGSVSDDGRYITAITGLRGRAHGAQEEGYAALWISVQGQWRRIVSPAEGDESEFTLDAALLEPDTLVGATFVTTRIGPGDLVTIPQVTYWERE